MIVIEKRWKNFKIIDPALINNGPISPVRSKVYSLALFLGLLIPAALAYIIELFNDKIRYRDDIQKQTNTPIIAEVGHSDGTQTLVVTSKSRKVIAEQFRMIRTNIQYLVGTKSKFTVLITSSFSGEGKSFISTNVAAALALTGKKTVILEFDLRKPKIIEGLGMVKAAGISNFVVGKADIKDIIRPVPNYDNLFVVGCGAIPPNPAELLLEDNITELFNYLQSNFDAVIIDSAPVGLVTDSMTLSKFADTTLYIVRHKYTLKKQIKLVDELYTSEKLPKLSIVINDVIGSTGGYYGYGGYGYGYGRSYGYGYGYFEEVKRNRLKEIWNSIKSFLSFWK
jgi:tyrosine-protein kinase Etk/Wzc